MSDFLTADEHRAMELSASLYLLLDVIVGNGPLRLGDLRELTGHIHGIQHAILSQAAARAYPHAYRLLGEQVRG